MVVDPSLLQDAERTMADAEKLVADVIAKFTCPHCQHDRSTVTGGRMRGRRYLRYRRCLRCQQTFTSLEVVVKTARPKKLSTSCELSDPAPSP